MLSKHSYACFYTFYLNFFSLKKENYLTINNEYESMIFTILRGCLPYFRMIKAFTNEKRMRMLSKHSYVFFVSKHFLLELS